MDDLLVFEGRITVPATAPQYFPQEGTARYPSQKIVWPISRMSDDVSTVFFEGPWVQECTVDEQTLRFYRVLRSTKCSIFLALLGEHAETTFSKMLAFLKMQKRMQGGVLARSDVKVFLIRDLSHALRFVFASWHKKGWSIWTRSMDMPFAYMGGDTYRIFSPVPAVGVEHHIIT